MDNYREWILFALIIMLFISIAGVALRHHFERPYVKPLIIAVGSLLSFSVFTNREYLVLLIQGWGKLGVALLVCMSLIIPFALVRGLGMAKSRAFWLAFALIYALSWTALPDLHMTIAESTTGLANLIMLVLFLVALWHIFRPSKSKGNLAQHDLLYSPRHRTIEQEAAQERNVFNIFKKKGARAANMEMGEVEEMEKAVSHVIEVLEQDPRGLSREDREAISKELMTLSGKENDFNNRLVQIKKLAWQSGYQDSRLLRERLKRLTDAPSGEVKLVRAELEDDRKKIQIERAILDYENKLEKGIQQFEMLIRTAVDQLRRSDHPIDAKSYLIRSKQILQEISQILQLIKDLETRLAKLCRHERKLLGKEAKAA